MNIIKLITASAALFLLASCSGHSQQGEAVGAGLTCDAITAQVNEAAAAISTSETAGDPCGVLVNYQKLDNLIKSNVQAAPLAPVRDNFNFTRVGAVGSLTDRVDLDEFNNGGRDQGICDVFVNSMTCPGMDPNAFKNMLFDILLDTLRTQKNLAVSSASVFINFRLGALIKKSYGTMDTAPLTRNKVVVANRMVLDKDCLDLVYDWLIAEIEAMKTEVTCDMTIGDFEQYTNDNIVMGFRDIIKQCPIKIAPDAISPAEDVAEYVKEGLSQDY